VFSMSLAYRWLSVVLFMIALFAGGYLKGCTDAQSKHTKELLEATQETRVIEQKRSALQQETLNAKDAQLRSVNARLADSLERLRQRPERLPEASLATCTGSTGRELSGRDAAFLERYAARAEALRAELKASQDREHAND
jgi:hypothetical protein